MREENIVIGEGTQYPLNGLLTLPDKPERDIPALVLVHGSGPHDMDQTTYKNKPFKDIAEALAAHGIAVLRYDKRTYAYGRDLVEATKAGVPLTAYKETIEDAAFAAQLLRRDPRIGKVFLFGHSMGATLGPRIDATGGNFDGLILAAGTTRAIREIMFEQMDEAMRRYKGLRGFIARWQIKKNKPKLLEIDTWTEEELKTKDFILGKGIAYHIKDMEAHPPGLYTKDMTKPLFVIQGDKDFQVSVEKDFAGFQRLLADYPDVTFKLYEGLNHIFTTSHGTRSVEDYQVAGKVSSQVTDDIAAWIHEKGNR
jgi:dienelactone hydrolase